MKPAKLPLVVCLASLTLLGVALGAPWPGETWQSSENLTHLDSDFADNMSGSFWNPHTKTLWVCDTWPGRAWALVDDGAGSFEVDYKAGKRGEWPVSDDAEGITQAALDEDVIYVIDESSGTINEYDVSTYGTAVLRNRWDITDDIPPLGTWEGSEAITFVPDEWLARGGFVDRNGTAYQSTNGMGGLMLVGHQNAGAVYAFDLNRANGTYTFVGRYLTSRGETSGLEFDRSNGLLYVWHNTGPNYLEATDLSSYVSGIDRKFVKIIEYEAPKGGNLESIAFSPVSEPENWAFIIDDDNQDGYAVMWYKQFDPIQTTDGAPLISLSGVSNITDRAAQVDGFLTHTGSAPTAVYVCWGTANGGKTLESWTGKALVGTNVSKGRFSTTVTGLTAETVYYYRCYATNFSGEAWTSPWTISSLSFVTAVEVPFVVNAGASNITFTSADLCGALTSAGSEPTEVYVFWGRTDGGTNEDAWGHANPLGKLGAGSFSHHVSGLLPNTAYIYRCYATNAAKQAWAPSSTRFVTGDAGLSGSLDIWIEAGDDDAEEGDAGDNMYLTSSDLELIYDGDVAGQGRQTVGVRFRTVNIPSGARITNAYIQFTADEAAVGALHVTIQGQNADNAPAFSTTASNISSRVRTAAVVNWTPPEWGGGAPVGPDQRTPDLSGIVREIVNRPGWCASNAIVMIITGTDTTARIAESYEGAVGHGNAQMAPMLHVDWRIEDVDSDGMWDNWEVQYFGDNTNSNGGSDDDDGDLSTDESEFHAGTDPTDPTSVFALLDVMAVDRNIAVCWSSVSNRFYGIDESTDLSAGFSNVAGGIAATPPVNSYTNTIIERAAKYYRIRVKGGSP